MSVAVKERLPFFDNFKGILIILVVIGHFFNGAAAANIIPAWYVFDFIYMFHMPLFIFVSGLFSKSVYENRKAMRSGVVLYYMALCWLMYLALWVPQAIMKIAAPFNLLTVNASMPWYLMAIAIYTALVPLFSKIKPILAICGAFCLAILSGLVNVGDIFSASRVVVFLPFFLIGYYLQPKSILERISKLGNRLLLARVISICIILFIFFGFTFLTLNQMQFNQTIFTGVEPYSTAISIMPSANNLICCIVRTVGFAMSLVMGICIMVLTPKGDIFALSRTGRHTLQVYILHAFVSYIFTYIKIAPLVYTLMPAAIASIFICVCGVLISFILGYPNFIQTWFDKLKNATRYLLIH